MKVFISWSGELSKKIAQELKKWIPCIIQSVEVFYSPEDIEKGENWDSKISVELSECNFGIICLTSENTNAPWIHFEAGAIAKALDSRVSALMLNIKTSDIQGPLKRYQATKFEKDDFFQLVDDINKVTANPISKSVLETAFNAIWDSMYNSMSTIISTYKSETRKSEDLKGEPIEEILQLLRKQNVLLSSPEQLLSPSYLRSIINESKDRDRYGSEELIDRLMLELNRIVQGIIAKLPTDKFNVMTYEYVDELMKLLQYYSRRVSNRTRSYYLQTRDMFSDYTKRNLIQSNNNDMSLE